MKKLLDAAAAKIAREEGYRKHQYDCTAGYPTFGFGCNIAAGLSRRAAAALLREQIAELHDELAKDARYIALNDARKVVVIGMCFQMGRAGVRKFRKAIKHGVAGDWERCAAEMLDSAWARQTPARAKRNAAIMVSGKLPT